MFSGLRGWVWSALGGCFLFLSANAASLPWLNQIRLAGLSGPADHRLAIINDKTFGVGDENDLKLPGVTLHVACVAITDGTVLLRIAGLPGLYDLTESGQIIPLLPPEARDEPSNLHQSSPAPSASPPPQPPAPDVSAVQPTTLSLMPEVNLRSAPEGLHTLTPLVFWLGMGAAWLFGILIGTYATLRWEHNRNMGEALVVDMIETRFSRRHVLLNNVTLPMGEGTTQIDHVLVADTGVFVIETKHYSGWIFGAPGGSQWTQQKYRKKSRFQNPLRQNYAHLATLKSLFTLPDDHFHSVVVFTHTAEFKTDLGHDVVRLDELISHLNKERPEILDERKMAYIVGRIEMHRERRSLETDEYHINYLRNKLRKTPRRVRANPFYTLDSLPQSSAPAQSEPVSAKSAEHPHSRYMPKE